MSSKYPTNMVSFLIDQQPIRHSIKSNFRKDLGVPSSHTLPLHRLPTYCSKLSFSFDFSSKPIKLWQMTFKGTWSSVKAACTTMIRGFRRLTT